MSDSELNEGWYTFSGLSGDQVVPSCAPAQNITNRYVTNYNLFTCNPSIDFNNVVSCNGLTVYYLQPIKGIYSTRKKTYIVLKKDLWFWYLLYTVISSFWTFLLMLAFVLLLRYNQVCTELFASSVHLNKIINTFLLRWHVTFLFFIVTAVLKSLEIKIPTSLLQIKHKIEFESVMHLKLLVWF